MKPMRYGALRVTGSLLLLALTLSACGGGGSEAQSAGEMAAGKGARASGMQASADLPASSAGSGAVGVSESETISDGFDRKVIKTAELGIRAEDVRESAADAQQVAARFGGSVDSSRISRGDGSVYADLVLSIPSPDFEAALEEMRGLGKEVTTDSVSGEDVTEEYVDLESRERNLLAAEESLLKLYDRAESVEDTLTVQRELTNVRGEIELVQGRLKYLDQRTAFSQITLSIQPLPSPKPSEPAWNPARVVAQAWNASLGVLQTIATAIISAVVFGWWITPALIAGFVWWKRRNRELGSATSSS